MKLWLVSNQASLSNKIRFGIVVLVDHLLVSSRIGSSISKANYFKLNNFLKRLTPETIIINNNEYYINDPGSLFVFHPGFERKVWRYLNLKKGEIFVDVGAHIGAYTINTAKIASNVIAIEANPENFKVLIKNISLHKLDNVIPYNVAAYNVNKKLKLYFGMDSRGGTVTSDRHVASLKLTLFQLMKYYRNLVFFQTGLK